MTSNTNTNPYKNLALVGMAFGLLGAVLSAMLVCKHVFPEFCTSSMGCTINGVDGCKNLGLRPESKLFGTISLSLPGLFYYILMAAGFGMLAFTSSEKEKEQKGLILVLLSLAVFGLVFVLRLAYINFFVLETYCKLCAYTYIALAGLFIIAVLLFLQVREGIEGGPEFSAGIKNILAPVLLGVIGTALVFGVMMGLAGKKSAGDGHEGHAHSHGGHEEPVPLIALKSAASFEARVMEVARETPSRFSVMENLKLNTKGLEGYEGGSDAYIEIHKFADFQCGHCYHAGEILKKALARWPKQIKVYYRHFPLDGSCNKAMEDNRGGFSCTGAQAAICAPEQKIFSKVYHGIFDFQPTRKEINLPNLEALVDKAGGDWSKMLGCMGSAQTARTLERDVKDSLSVKLNATPTIVINNKLVFRGTPNVETFLNYLDALVLQKEGQKAVDDFNKRNGN